jgi:hypothetical protein
MRLETFLVRIWTGTDSGEASGSTARQPAPPDLEALTGVVRHVRTGAEGHFTRLPELLAFLAADRGAPAESEPADGLPAAAAGPMIAEDPA